MRIGILGPGLMGAKLGTIFARAGHEVVFSYARSEDKLKRLARKAGGKARAGTRREAAQDADAVLLAVHWLRFDDVLAQAGDLSGKVVVTCSLPIHNAWDVVAYHVFVRMRNAKEPWARLTPRGRAVQACEVSPIVLAMGR
jgi:8-hydroxy-5-deazaflavin:NADPH oxidoreductase